jgi:hypothetical protein
MSDTQNYANHRRNVPGYHYFTFALILAAFIWAVTRLVQHPSVDSAMVLVVVLAITMVGWYARAFPIAVQNRLIRLEEQLRLARVLPAELQPRIGDLTMKQLIGLRFASDAELPELVARVLKDGITSGEDIKKLIRTWRPDEARA